LDKIKIFNQLWHCHIDTVSAHDLLETEVRYDNDREKWIQAQNNVRLARATFNLSQIRRHSRRWGAGAKACTADESTMLMSFDICYSLKSKVNRWKAIENHRMPCIDANIILYGSQNTGIKYWSRRSSLN
jgi:hypothetical protein